MAFSSESKLSFIVFFLIAIMLSIEMLRNDFYNPWSVILIGGLVMTCVMLLMGTVIPRIADPFFISLRKKDFGIYGRYRSKTFMGKGVFRYIAVVPNYIMTHIGEEGMIKGMADVVRGETPRAFQTHETNFISVGPDECVLPEGMTFIVDETTPDAILSKKLTQKYTDLSYKYDIAMLGLEQLKKLGKSLQGETGRDMTATAEEIGRITDEVMGKKEKIKDSDDTPITFATHK